jgi:hypothetical protein
MPYPCFSYPADAPPGTRNRNAAQETLRGLRRMPYPCFSYPHMCFSYPADVLLDTRNRAAAQPDQPGLRKMPSGTCFRY